MTDIVKLIALVLIVWKDGAVLTKLSTSYLHHPPKNASAAPGASPVESMTIAFAAAKCAYYVVEMAHYAAAVMLAFV